jgi:hypothetical protein
MRADGFEHLAHANQIETVRHLTMVSSSWKPWASPLCAQACRLAIGDHFHFENPGGRSTLLDDDL